MVDAGTPAGSPATRQAQSRVRTAARPALGPGDLAGTLAGQTLDGRFRIARKVGEGGMAYVYQAHDLVTDRTVAVKVLSPRLMNDATSAARLRREAQLATRLDHPNVCPILALVEPTGGLRYLVMPYLEGETLNAWELREGVAGIAFGVALLSQMCLGLHYAHGLHILHRDLKPENVMLVPDGRAPDDLRAVIMDFGLAKELQPGTEVRKLTSTGIVPGTPEFMSPEQIRGKPLDARSDIFSLAVLAFELFTGELPFAGDSAQDVMRARLAGRPRAMRTFRRDVPQGLEAVVAKALTRDPAGRYPTMEAFAEALAPFGAADGPSIGPKSLGSR